MRNLLIILKRTVNTAVQWIFPLRCPVCDDIVTPYGNRICAECRDKLKILTPPWCLQCGKKLMRPGEYCEDCRRKKHKYIRGRALYEYNSAKLPIYRFKYGGRAEYAEYFGQEISRNLGDFIREVNPDALIPVPLHKKRMRKRGYNQAQLLAEAVGRYTDIPVMNKMLVRVKNTRPLKKLNPVERQNNLKKAFNISENDVKLKTIIIIDDIYTTGSTIDEAADVLINAGVRDIYFITLACGVGI
jgi:ComF family protein